mgnify:CR=1 FL=1
MSTAITFPDEPELSPTELLRREASRLRASAPRTPLTQPARDPHAVEALPPHRRPFARSMATRKGRARSRRQERWALRRTTQIVHASGIVPREWPADPEVFPWHCVDAGQAAEIHDLMRELYPHPGTANNRLGEVRRMLRLSHKAKLLSRSELDDLLDELPVPKAHWTRPGRALAPDEIAALLRASASGASRFIRARDAAMIATLASTGARAGEVCDVTYDDWDRANQSLFFALTKNGNPHTVFLHPTATHLLEAWVDVRGTEPGPLFISKNGWRSQPHGIEYDAVLTRVRHLCKVAGVRRIGTHDFRRTVATTLLRTTDIATVAHVLNHVDINSTAAYDRAADELARQAVETLPLPEIQDTRGGER